MFCEQFFVFNECDSSVEAEIVNIHGNHSSTIAIHLSSLVDLLTSFFFCSTFPMGLGLNSFRTKKKTARNCSRRNKLHKIGSTTDFNIVEKILNEKAISFLDLMLCFACEKFT